MLTDKYQKIEIISGIYKSEYIRDKEEKSGTDIQDILKSIFLAEYELKPCIRGILRDIQRRQKQDIFNSVRNSKSPVSGKV